MFDAATFDQTPLPQPCARNIESAADMHAMMFQLCILEIAEDKFRCCRIHRAVVIRSLPQLRFLLVTGRARRSADPPSRTKLPPRPFATDDPAA